MTAKTMEWIRSAAVAIAALAVAYLMVVGGTQVGELRGGTKNTPGRFATASANLQPPDAPQPVPVAANQAHFGYNMQGNFGDPAADAAAVAGGAKIVRWQPAWSSVENYATGSLALKPEEETALRYFGAHRVKVIAVCAYGPPFSNVFNVTVASNVRSGSYTIPIQSNPGISRRGTDYIEKTDNSWITGIANYPGGLIASASGNTITLASHLTTSLSAGTVLKINRNRYPAVASTSPNDPSVAAYFRYLKFVAGRIAANGAGGWVAIWNEDLWAHDLWNAQGQLYDNPPAGLNPGDRMHEFLQYALRITDLPAGVRIINGASDKTGFSGVLSQGLPVTSTTVARNISFDSVHPYGNLPEQQMWNSHADSNGRYALLNPSVDAATNFRGMAYLDVHSGTGLRLMATETGADIANDNRQAVDLPRRVAALWAAGAPPVIYALNEGTTFDVMHSPTSPRASYTALQRLANVVGTLTPGGSANSVPAEIRCGPGHKWPSYVVAVYGSNGVVLLAWQRTGYNSTATWSSLATPATYQCQFTLPSGLGVKSATDLVSGASVPASASGTTLTLGAVGEDVQAITLG